MGSKNTNLSGKVPHGDLHILASADYGQITQCKNVSGSASRIVVIYLQHGGR